MSITKTLLVTSCLYLPVFAYAAPSCDAVFPGAIASNSLTGEFVIWNSGQIIDDPQPTELPFTSMNEWGPTTSCAETKKNGKGYNTFQCEISGAPALSAELPEFENPVSGSLNKSYTYPCYSEEIFTQHDYGNLTLNGSCVPTYKVSEVNSKYRFGDVKFDEGAHLILPPGDYFFNSLNMANGTITVDQSSGSGAVKIHVKNALTVNNDSKINADGSANNMILYVHGELPGNSFNMTSSAKVTSFLYVDSQANQGRVVLDNDAVFTGRMSVGNLTVRGNAIVEYSGDPTQVDFGDMCTTSSGMASCPAESDNISKVTINEFHVESNKNWIELYTNNTPDGINLKGWKIKAHGAKKGSQFEFELFNSDKYFEQGQYLVFTDGGNGYTSPPITHLFLKEEVDWHNNFQEILLVDDEGKLVHYLKYQQGEGNENEWDDCLTQSPQASTLIEPPGNKATACAIEDGEIDKLMWSSDCESTVGYTNNPEQIDHYEIIHPTTALSCIGAEVSVKTCLDASCTQIATEQASATLNKVISGTTSIINADAFTGSKTSNFTQAGEQAVSLNLSALSPNAGVICKDNSGNASNCEIQFSDSGLFVSQASGRSCADLSLNIQALKSDQSLNCAPAWQGNKSVNLSFSYASPANNPENTQASLNNTLYTAGVSQTTTLSFNSSAQASLAVNYADAGTISITASDPENILATGTGQLTLAPAEFALTASNTQHQIAATHFSYQLQAQCSDGSPTPNYQPDNVQLKLAREVPTGASYTGQEAVFSYNASGSSLSSAAIGSANFQAADNISFSSGRFEFTQAQINEVGRFQLTVQDADYLSSGLSVISNTLDLGLFIPDNLAVYQASDTLPSGFTDGRIQGQFEEVINSGINWYNYLGQNFSYQTVPKVQILAENALGETLYNYSPALNTANLAFDPGQLSASSAEGKTITVDFKNGTLTANNDGSYIYQLSPDDTLSYTKTAANSELLPFESDIRLTFNAEFFVDASLNQITNQQDKSISPDSASIRSGRLVTDNNFGPETDALTLPVYIQTYSASGWVTATDDSQTQLTSDAFTFGGSSHNSGDNWQNSYSLNTNKTTSLSAPLTSAADVESQNGYFIFNFNAPGAGNSGTLSNQIDLTQVPYLQHDWNADNTLDTQINSELIWGLYRGNDRVLYWREAVK